MSVRQRAVDLLYAMCDTNNAEEIVAEMLTYLETADYAIKEEMVGAKNDEFIVFFSFCTTAAIDTIITCRFI